MNQAAFLGSGQSTCDLQRNLKHEDRRKRPVASQAGLERFPFDELHRVKAIARIDLRTHAHRFVIRSRRSVARAEVKYTGDVRMAKSCSQPGLMQETAARFGPSGKSGVDNLERDRCVQVHIPRLVSDAHRPTTQLPTRPVRASQDFVVLKKTRPRFVRRREILCSLDLEPGPRRQLKHPSSPPHLFRGAPHCSQIRLSLWVDECIFRRGTSAPLG